MRSTHGIILFWTLSFCTGSSDWGYVNEKGPDHWKDLFPDACAGRHQSPIDIRTDQTVYDPSLKDFSIFFDPPLPGSKFYVHNNGHSIQVNTEGKFYVSNGGLQNIYSTAQFHFHWGHKNHHGSEHTVDGAAAPIEMHIVNWNTDRYDSIAEAAVKPGGLAVLGILFEVSKEDNPVLEPLVNVLKHVRDPDHKIKTEIPAVSMRTFLPAAPDRYYRYNGSLTTPGCFESVVWTVFNQKQTISRRQLHVFRQVLKPTHHRRKRSAKHESRAVRAVFEELGIEENPFEKSRFRRQLEEKVATEHVETMSEHDHGVAMEKSTKTMPAEHHPEQNDTRHEPSTHAPMPEPDQPKHHTNTHTQSSQQSHADQVRQLLVNNYRPVQPLNGRTVYRSFPFFDEPIRSDTEVVYIDMDGSREGNSANSVHTLAIVVFLCSMHIFRFL